MNTFRSIDELVNALNREKILLKEMFAKRKTLSFRYDYAQELTEHKDERIQFLINYGIIRDNSNFLELEDVYLKFFEDVLEVNEEINVLSVKAYIDHLNETIEYYLNETKENARYNYLREIKRSLTNIALNTKRNAIDLKRNIDNTYKNEPNYKNKKSKLNHLDEKRQSIAALIKETEKLIAEKQPTFFAIAMDTSLKNVVTEVRESLIDSYHNLMEIDRQIVEYLNLVDYQNQLLKKIHSIKYYRDQQTLETNTDIVQKLNSNNTQANPVWMENPPAYRIKPSLETLRNSEIGLAILKEVRKKQANTIKAKSKFAEALQASDFDIQTEIVRKPDSFEIKNAFLASGEHLFKFLMHYHYDFDVAEDDKIQLFCQIAVNYYDELNITEQFERHGTLVYPLIYPK